MSQILILPLYFNLHQFSNYQTKLLIIKTFHSLSPQIFTVIQEKEKTTHSNIMFCLVGQSRSCGKSVKHSKRPFTFSPLQAMSMSTIMSSSSDTTKQCIRVVSYNECPRIWKILNSTPNIKRSI